MQGAGYYDIRFVSSPEFASRNASKYSVDIDEANIIPLAECDLDALVLRVDEDFFAGTSAVVYVLNTNKDWNHPQSSAVIIDTDSGKIEFSQYG